MHAEYDGGVLKLPRLGTRLEPASMPALAAKRGHDIVTGSGDTLLGADDKAGVAEILAAVAHLAAHPELPRPTLRVAFTPTRRSAKARPCSTSSASARSALTPWTDPASADLTTRRSRPTR